MFDNFLMSMNNKLKKIIQKLDNEKTVIDKIDNNVETVNTNLATVQSTSDEIKALIGTEIATQLSVLKDEIVAAIGSNSNSVIKSIQRGTTTGTTVTLAQSVNPDKCIVLLDNQYIANNTVASHGGSSLSANSSKIPTGATIVSLTETTLTLTANETYSGDLGSLGARVEYKVVTGTVSWQVIEFY